MKSTVHSRVLQDCTLLSIPSKNLYFQAILSMLLIHTRATGRWSNSGNGNKWNSPVVPSYSPQQQTFSAPSNCQSTIYSVDPRKTICPGNNNRNNNNNVNIRQRVKRNDDDDVTSG